jgi:hypothetical protein
LTQLEAPASGRFNTWLCDLHAIAEHLASCWLASMLFGDFRMAMCLKIASTAANIAVTVGLHSQLLLTEWHALTSSCS